MDVICVSTSEPTQWYYHWTEYLESLRRLGVTPTNIGEGKPWDGLMTKALILRDWLRSQGDLTGRRMIFTDAWDVLYVEHPDAIDARCERLYGDAVVFSGERVCWPDPSQTELFPPTSSPWRWMNGGMYAGPCSQVLAMLESSSIEAFGLGDANDQVYFIDLYLKQPVPIVVDQACEVFQSAVYTELDEFDLDDLPFRNRATGTKPGILHFPGNGKNTLMPYLLDRWGYMPFEKAMGR